MRAMICLGVSARRLPEVRGAVWLREPWAEAEADIVVRWGTPAGPAARVREYNRSPALARLGDRVERLQALAAAGLPVSDGRPERFYRVAVWDLMPCLVRVARRARRARRRRARAPVRPLDPGSSRLLREVARTAVRAVHALRLDFAAVDLLARSRQDIRVLDVDPAPAPDGPEGRALVRALAAALERGGGERDGIVMLGADPELLFRDGRRGVVVPASRYLAPEGPIGLDSARVPGSRAVRPIAEIRPEPSLDPDRLLLRIRRLLRRLQGRVHGRLHWIAGSGGSRRFPIGGHIHFGGIHPNAALLRALDAYLAIPVLLLEDPERARLRRRRYGWIGDFRLQDWGFEYRTLPSWLVAPRYARAVLHLAALIARHWPRLTRDPFVDPGLHRAFLACDKEPFYSLFPDLWSDLQALPDYAEAAEALEVLARAVAARRVWPERRDIRRAWGIR